MNQNWKVEINLQNHNAKKNNLENEMRTEIYYDKAYSPPSPTFHVWPVGD